MRRAITRKAFAESVSAAGAGAAAAKTGRIDITSVKNFMMPLEIVL